MSDVDPYQKEVGDQFAAKAVDFDRVRCNRCFKKIKDVNGVVLPEEHKCEKVIDALSQEISVVMKKYHDGDKDTMLLTLHSTVNYMLDRHLKRRAWRKRDAAKGKTAQEDH